MANGMKANPFAGTGKVYAFSLRQMICSKGWLLSTILIALLMIVGIPAALWGLSASQSPNKKSKDQNEEIKAVLVVDETEGAADYQSLQEAGYSEVSYAAYDSMEQAITAANEAENAVILRVTKPAESFSLTVYLADKTEVSRSKASSFGNFAANNFSVILLQKAALSAEAADLLAVPVKTETAELRADASAEDPNETLARELLTAAIPFMMVMTIYMMVILYGQSMSNSVMLEKTSKLMETILTAVHPFALMGGKLLATATAAVAQLSIWMIALFAGMIGGAAFALRMVPDTSDATVNMITDISGAAIQVSVGGILLSIVIFALGFLLYLSLSGISGALASKTEDLNKTTIVYMLFLIVSFLVCLGDPADAERTHSFISGAAWLDFFPFTSILVTPGRLIFKEIPLWRGCVSICILIVSVILMVMLAGAIYKMLVLYRGKPPKIKELIAMLKQEKQNASASDRK